MAEGLEAARLLESYGYDALDTDVGTYDAWWWNHPPMYQEKGLYRKYCKMVKEVVSIPVFCAGRMDDPDMALEAIRSGVCDIIDLGRPLLADPDYCNKLRGRTVPGDPPLHFLSGGVHGPGGGVLPDQLRSQSPGGPGRVTAYAPVLRQKKVLIVGGGVAGCEAARVLAIRGHLPVLYEKGSRLGGNLLPGGAPEFKEDDLALARWYADELARLRVPVYLNTVLTRSQILEQDFDALIIATGSTPKVFSLGDDDRVYTAAQVLLGRRTAAERPSWWAAAWSGVRPRYGWRSMERKLLSWRRWTVLWQPTDRSAMLTGICWRPLLPFQGVTVVTGAEVKCYRNGVLSLAAAGRGREIPCDSVILAVGYREEDSLYRELEFDVPELYLLGDARKVSNIMYAIWDAFEVANHI